MQGISKAVKALALAAAMMVLGGASVAEAGNGFNPKFDHFHHGHQHKFQNKKFKKHDFGGFGFHFGNFHLHKSSFRHFDFHHPHNHFHFKHHDKKFHNFHSK